MLLILIERERIRRVDNSLISMPGFRTNNSATVTNVVESYCFVHNLVVYFLNKTLVYSIVLFFYDLT